ncbi:MAG TPA: hypothetical protein VNV16_01195 [Methylibium sp.]|nr:hypothetical protein [Methylibium sp.]
MKSLDDLKSDMSDLYEEVRSGKTELKTAAELANIAGKYLKAEQLQLAREIFTAGQGDKPKLKAAA